MVGVGLTACDVGSEALVALHLEFSPGLQLPNT